MGVPGPGVADYHPEAGEFDVIAIGRALLADAAWVDRLRDDPQMAPSTLY